MKLDQLESYCIKCEAKCCKNKAPGDNVSVIQFNDKPRHYNSNGICEDLGIDNRCTTYSTRPMICKTYPFYPYFNKDANKVHMGISGNCPFGQELINGVMKQDEEAVETAEQVLESYRKMDLPFRMKVLLNSYQYVFNYQGK